MRLKISLGYIVRPCASVLSCCSDRNSEREEELTVVNGLCSGRPPP